LGHGVIKIPLVPERDGCLAALRPALREQAAAPAYDAMVVTR
jgi:hypothetical protein